MKLTVFTPFGMVLQQRINKVTVETLNGYYTLLPKHVDFAAAMPINIVSYEQENGESSYIACYQGIVVKKKDVVTITVQNAVEGRTIQELKEVIRRDFKQHNESRKELNLAMARLELGIVRGFGKLSRGDADG